MPFMTGMGWISAQSTGRGRQRTPFQMAAGKLPAIRRKPFFQTPYPRFSRMDAYSRLGVSAIGLALEDAGLKHWTVKREAGIVAATINGCLQTDLDYFETVMPENGAFAGPALFSYTLPSCFLGEAAARFGLTGPTYVVSGQKNGLSSVGAVLEEMACTGLETALAGICDLAPPSDFPVDETIIPGAAFMVIEKAPVTEQKPYGTLHLKRTRQIFFDGGTVSDFKTLMETALKRIRK